MKKVEFHLKKGNVKINTNVNSFEEELKGALAFVKTILPSWSDDVAFILANNWYELSVFVIEDFQNASFSLIEKHKPIILFVLHQRTANVKVTGYKRINGYIREGFNNIYEELPVDLEKQIASVINDKKYVEKQIRNFEEENKWRKEQGQGDGLDKATRVIWESEYGSRFLSISFDYLSLEA